jgi:chromosome segregation ATPase
MTKEMDSAFQLTEAWNRLEAVCRKLWDENSSNAVETQAIVEEFKGEVRRLDAYMANAEEMRQLAKREREEDLAAMRRQYEMELASLKKRLELQEISLREKDARAEDLMKTIARKEEENLNFHSQLLRMSAASDETKTRKMEEFYGELMKKEGSLADSWQQRHLTLEKEHEHLQQILVVRQSELAAWEQRCLTEEEALKKKSTDLEIKTQHLAQDYRQKQQEIENLKASLQKSITDLIRQYRARTGQSTSEPSPSTPPQPR